MSEKQLDAAINHYIEAGVSVKAIEAAFSAMQWNKAVQLVDSLAASDVKLARQYYRRIAKHYRDAKARSVPGSCLRNFGSALQSFPHTWSLQIRVRSS